MIPKLVTRTQWGAQPARSSSRIARSSVRLLVVHYTAAGADERRDHAECAARVRGVQRFHMSSDQIARGGASDVAYNWLVCRHGYVFKGRGIGRRQAATGPANGYSLAVCFLGNDDAGKRDATPAARRAIRAVLAHVDEHCPNLEGVRGHRDFMSTTCPGDELYAFARVLDAQTRKESP